MPETTSNPPISFPGPSWPVRRRGGCRSDPKPVVVPPAGLARFGRREARTEQAMASCRYDEAVIDLVLTLIGPDRPGIVAEASDPTR